MLTLAQLIAYGIAPTQARAFIGPINLHCPRFGITTRPRMAAFLAEARYESGDFVKLEESFFYRDAGRLANVFRRAFRSPAEAVPFVMGRDPKGLANRVYAGVNGNGPESSGDGWRFRGRGLPQLTTRGNYLAVGRVVGRDWISSPDELLQPDGATLALCGFWALRNLNGPADRGDVDAISRIINPAALGAAERKQLFNEIGRALAALEF